MAILFTLAEITPHRLRYICEGDGEGGTTILPNTGIAGPADLRGDASIIEGSPIDSLVSTPVVDQAAARKLLLGTTLTTAADINTPRAHLKLTPKTIAVDASPWAADADLGAGLSAGYPVIVVTDPGAAEICYLDIEFEHTFIR